MNFYLKGIVYKFLRGIWNDKDERNLIMQIFMAFIVKGLSLIISFFSMPLYISFFDNDEVLGVWYTILAMLSWINICDLGLGNGLRNRLTEALSIGDEENAKTYVSSSYASMVVIILPIIFIIVVLIRFVDLNVFFNIHHSLISPKVLRQGITVLLIGVAFSFVLRTVNMIIYAIQKSAVNNWVSLITSVLPFIYIVFTQGGTVEENFLTLTFVHVLAINLPLLLVTILLFRSKNLRAISPSITYCKVDIAKSMLTLGIQFFLAQVFFMILNSTNEIMIIKLFSAADVVQYSVYHRLFTMIGSLFMLALTPLWSKVTKDLAQKKYRKIQITNRLLYGVAGIATLLEFAIVPFLQFIINIWLRDEAIKVNYFTGVSFALFGSIYIFNIVLTTVSNGIGKLQTQIWFYGFFSVLKFPIICLISQYVEWNVVVWYNAIAMGIFCLFQFIWLERLINELIKEN